MGSIASLLVLMSFSPPSTSLAGYALMRGAMAEIATWVFFPSFALTLVAGMLAIAVNPAFHNAGWAWVKLATGILVFAGSFQVLGSIQDEAKRSASALAGQLGSRDDRGAVWSRAKRVVGASCGLDRQCRAWRLAAAPHADPRDIRNENHESSLIQARRGLYVR